MAHRPGPDEPDLTDRILLAVSIAGWLIGGICVAVLIDMATTR